MLMSRLLTPSRLPAGCEIRRRRIDLTKKARSLTGYDAHNIQFLAGRHIMERLGFWQLRAKLPKKAGSPSP
jgi:hypothetical protein